MPMKRRWKRRERLGHDRSAALINQSREADEADEICRYCGLRGATVCDTLPADTCERALGAVRPLGDQARAGGKPDDDFGKPDRDRGAVLLNDRLARRTQALPRCHRHPRRWCPGDCQYILAHAACLHDRGRPDGKPEADFGKPGQTP